MVHFLYQGQTCSLVIATHSTATLRVVAMVEDEHPLHRHREERSDAAISLQAQPFFCRQMVGLKVRLPRFARNDLKSVLLRRL
jgi:hypothetical protein